MLIDYLKELNRKLGLPKNLSEMGVDESHMEEMLKDAQRTKIWEHCPRTTSVKEMEMLYKKALYRE